MRAAKTIFSAWVVIALAAGSLYSTVCDASCDLFGCSPVAQAEIVERSEDSGHCQQHEPAPAADETPHDRAQSSSSNGRRDEFPGCLAHVSAEALLPATISSPASAIKDAQPAAVERLISLKDFSSGALSFADASPSFRSPPTPEMLSVLRI